MNTNSMKDGLAKLLTRMGLALAVTVYFSASVSHGQADQSPAKQVENAAEKDLAGGIDSDASSALNYPITPWLSFGGKIEIEFFTEDNTDLDPGVSDHTVIAEPKLSLATLVQPAPGLQIFGETRFVHRSPLRNTTDDPLEATRTEFREGYILLRGLPIEMISLQIGRQRFADDREWLYDQRLDAVRVLIEKGPVSAEFSVSSMLVDPDGQEDEIVNYILYAAYRYAEKSAISLFGISRQDSGRKDRDPVFLGGTWLARIAKHHKLWLQGTALLGRERNKDLSGFGIDGGWSWRLDHELNPSITLAMALGSGDADTKDATDHAFQQTDLQDNNGKFWGNTKFKYYGEVFDPELSNMLILTIGAGIAPAKEFSVDLVYHFYRLVELADELRDAGVDEDLTGQNKDLGQEFNLILGWDPQGHFRASVTAGVFFPGSAFSNDDPAFGTEVKLQIAF